VSTERKNGNKWFALVLFAMVVGISLLPVSTFAQQTGIPAITFDVDQANSPEDIAVTLQIMLLLTVLTLAPSILIMMTSFVRLIVAFHFLRQALSTQSLPPNQMIVGLSLFLTVFIMAPVISDIHDNAWQPYAAQDITLDQAWDQAQIPLRDFMLSQTREKDLALFVQIANIDQPNTPDDLPMRVIIPGFIISELRIGFQIGFLIYMPMLIVDMVVASVLMSMGMMMLPPVMISLPFKLLLFVLVDGWYLVVESMVQSFK
jgi:flagellar biosynthesis protein FliP